MKIIILMLLIFAIIFLTYKLYFKKKKIEEINKEADENKPKFNNSGELLVSKDKYVQLLRQNVVDLINIVEDIVEKDSDDEIWKNNLLNALKILDVENSEKISDEYILEIRNLISNVEKYYNLG